MKHVVVVSASGQLGGGELSLLPVLGALARRGRVTLMAPAAGPLEDAAQEHGAEVSTAFRLPASVRASSGLYGAGGVRTAAAAAVLQLTLTRALRQLSPDLVYCNGIRPQVGATIPASLAGVRIAWHVRDFCRRGPVAIAWPALAVLPAVIIANSQATASQPALRHVRRRVRAIPNGIDLSTFGLRGHAPDGAPTIGMVAHLTPWKGHERFVRVVAALVRDHPDISARIAGASLYDTSGNVGVRERLQRLILDLGLEAVCRIESVPVAAMPAWLAGLSVLIHCPDEPEPFGRALAEAMAVGVPVVAAATGGAVEVVGPAGITLAPGDEPGLVEAVGALLQDRGRGERLARVGRARVESLYDERGYVAATVRALDPAQDGRSDRRSDRLSDRL